MDLKEVRAKYFDNTNNPEALKGDVVLGAKGVEIGLADKIGTLKQGIVEAVQRTSKKKGRRVYAIHGKKKGVNMDLKQVMALIADENSNEDSIQLAIAEYGDVRAETAKKSLLKAVDVAKEADLAQAVADGNEYRASLKQEVNDLTFKINGDENTAKLEAKIWGEAPIADLKAKVASLKAQFEALIPNQQLSDDKIEKQKKKVVIGGNF